MKRVFLLVWLCLCSGLANGAKAPSAAPQVPDEALIRTAIKAQADAWNRADIPAFMTAYENSPDTTFIGLTLRKGFQPILKRYQQNYTTREQMGTLTFNDLDVRLLPGRCGKAEIALVTGRFHLERAAKGEAKKDDGIFSLVWRKGPQGWKIVLDHTS
jgi:ketosteroid isomerase-like protein